VVNTRISSLATGGAYASTDEQPVVETAGVGPVKKTGSQLAEFIRDTIGAANVGGTGITFTPNDGSDTLTFDLTDMAEATIKGRSAGSGTGAPEDLTGAQVREITGNREVLTADRTYFVNASTGSDSNDGLSSGAPFLTIQKALDVVGGLDRSIYDVTIDATGSFSVTDGGSGALIAKFGPGSGSITLDGDTSGGGTANTDITQTNNGGFDRGIITVTNNGTCRAFVVQNLELLAGGSTSAIRHLFSGTGGILEWGNVKFSGSTTQAHIRVDVTGYAECIATYEINSGGVNHYQITTGSTLRVVNITGITVTGTPNFTAEFAGCDNLSTVEVNGSSYSGSATGKRYDVNHNSSINTNGGGANFFPGNAAGTTGSGGQYN
jgi:hypothetical protein